MSFIIQNLENILLQEFKYSIDPLPTLTSEELKKADLYSIAETTFRALGGVSEKLPIRTRKWSLSLENLAIQWDNELHFNKYRRQTLRSELYEKSKAVNKMKYLDHCRKHEKECLKAGLYGNKWHFSKAEEAFGPSEEPGDLGAKGSAAWKLRAWVDFLEDFVPLIQPIKVLRLSVWDELLINKRLVKLGDLLLAPTEEHQEVLLQYFKRRIATL